MKMIFSTTALVALSACVNVETPCRSGALIDNCDAAEVSRDKDRFAFRTVGDAVQPPGETPSEPRTGGGAPTPVVDTEDEPQTDDDVPVTPKPPAINEEPDKPAVDNDPDDDDDDDESSDDENDDDEKDDDDDGDGGDDDGKEDKKDKKSKDRKGHNHGWGDHTAGNGKGHDKSH